MSQGIKTLLWTLFGLAGGASLVVQAALNSGLRQRIDSVAWAGLMSYLGGTATMIAAVALAGPRPRLEEVGAVPWACWFGGLFGAAYIGVAMVLLPRVGAGVLAALIVAGQLLCSLVFDHLGLLGVPVHPLDARRAIGALLLVAGVACVRL